MVTASLTTALFVSLPTAFFFLLARRSKRSEEEIAIFRSSSCCVATHAREHMMRLHALDARRSSGLSPFALSIAVAVFLSGWCGLAADAVMIPSRVGVAASAGSMASGGLSAWRWGRGQGKLGSADGASQRRKDFLLGKVVWITGASSGLGEQLAISAAAKGAAGLILSGRREDALERVKRICEETARDTAAAAARRDGVVARVEVLPFDVADLEFVEKEAAARAIQLFGRVDALVLNAGISTRGSIEDTPLEVEKRVMTVNYFGPAGLAKGLLKATRTAAAAAQNKAETTAGAAPSGAAAGSSNSSGTEAPPGAVRFVVINSVQGKFGMAFRSSYAASKHALVGFFDCLRAEHAHRGVGVLNVFPGYVRTSLSVNALTADGSKHAQMDETTAKGRDPREVADDVWQAVTEGKEEVVLADLKTNVAVLLRALAPRTLFGIMAKRALKASVAGAN